MDRLTINAPLGLIHLRDNKESTMNAAIKKLSDYERLEEQGKLLKLPVAVGDKVYAFPYGKLLYFRVDRFLIYEDEILARLASDMDEYKFLELELDIADFGKEWFSAKEAAELKEISEVASCEEDAAPACAGHV